MFLRQLLYTTTELYSVLSFISDVWPSLLMSLLFSSFLFLCWYFGYEYFEQKLWLEKNQILVEQYKTLQLHLKKFGAQTSCCKNCNRHTMQLWDYKKQFLVVRCRSCKMTYTYAKENNPLVLKVLHEIKGVTILLNRLISYRYHAFGRLLARLLAIDIELVNATTTPLEIVHFTARNEDLITPKFVMDILILDWQVVLPEKSIVLAS